MSSTSEKTGIYLDSDLKRRLGIEALRRGQTISDLIAEAIRAYLRISPEEREKIRAFVKARHAKAKAPAPPPEPAPSLPGLAAPPGGQVQGEPEGHVEQKALSGRARVAFDEEV
jgi:hypothetical protein